MYQLPFNLTNCSDLDIFYLEPTTPSTITSPESCPSPQNNSNHSCYINLNIYSSQPSIHSRHKPATMPTASAPTPLEQLEDAELELFRIEMKMENSPYPEAYEEERKELADRCLAIIHGSTIEELQQDPRVFDWEDKEMRRRMASLRRKVARRARRLS
ncbi:hypothetical protein DFP73DRAFT_541512 [Morchella snyderi]|nr:hypothetical protein DFP73DRAFT_541512 [Morchella snyderi]